MSITRAQCEKLLVNVIYMFVINKSVCPWHSLMFAGKARSYSRVEYL